MVPIWVTPIEEESGRGRLLPPRFNLYKGQQQFWRAWRWWQWWRRKSRTRRWTRRWMRRWTRKWRGTENLFCHLGWIFTRVSRTFGQNNPNQQNSSTRLNVMDRKHHTAHHTRKHHTQLQKSWRAEDSSLWGENNKPSQMKMQTLEISGVHQKIFESIAAIQIKCLGSKYIYFPCAGITDKW